jgi:hypothetical protein
MKSAIVLELAADEADAVSNALNHFAYAVDAGECQTLLGCDQELARRLFERLRDARAK